MTDPDRPDQRLVNELADRYQQAARRLREKIIAPPGKALSTQQWNQARATTILNQVDQEIALLKKDASSWTGTAVTQAVNQGVAVADRQAENAGVRPSDSPLKGSFSIVDRKAVEVMAKDTVSDLYHAADSMRRQADNVLRRMAATGVSNADVNAILTGGIIEGKPKDAINNLRDALKSVHGDKVIIQDKNGRDMAFDTGEYARMVANTKTRQATCQARHIRLRQHGVDLVIITGRQTNNFCSDYLGEVFSISGTSDKYPPLSSLPGGGPPFHPNCSKGTAPFVEALADSGLADPK